MPRPYGVHRRMAVAFGVRLVTTPCRIAHVCHVQRLAQYGVGHIGLVRALLLHLIGWLRLSVDPYSLLVPRMAALFTHILVPLDFTGKDDVALRAALDLAQQNRAQVTLLHVIQTIEYAEDDEIAHFYETLKNRARARLAMYADRFHDAGIPVEQKIVLGQVARGIVSYALQKGHDLVLLSSHKVKLDEPPKGWATTSYQVSILCQCPVLLVK